ncbi:hypothetical protein L3X38_037122 [Prunus dulcis]|uniref:Reverse transcriptase/retrotransposon-derived protein RNase H-like domain-containing protein n=1 Tax=Prunus dulcis TaxID=3755 RepID=A0AAD4V2I5_PRUDU|nr:hypothetical protein L3X38_037122 [Prunus dulcis]
MFGVSFDRFLGYLVTQRGIETHPIQIKAILNMKSPPTTKEIQILTSSKYELAFQNLKTYLTSPLLLSKSIPGEDLYIYLAVSGSAVSSALNREELGAQHHAFYTSKALTDAETPYLKMEKLIFSHVVSARKLRPYY